MEQRPELSSYYVDVEGRLVSPEDIASAYESALTIDDPRAKLSAIDFLFQPHRFAMLNSEQQKTVFRLAESPEIIDAGLAALDSNLDFEEKYRFARYLHRLLDKDKLSSEQLGRFHSGVGLLINQIKEQLGNYPKDSKETNKLETAKENVQEMILDISKHSAH